MFSFTGFLAMSNMEISSRDLLQSWGYFSLWMFLTFLGGVSKVVSKFFNRFRASWRLCSIWYLWGYPLLPPILRIPYRLSGSDSFWGLSIVLMFFLILGGYQKLLEGLFCSRECFPRIILPDFYYCRLLTNNLSMVRFPSLWRRLNVAVFPHFLWWGED